MPRLTKRADGRYRMKYHDTYYYGKTQNEVKKKVDEAKRLEAQGISQKQKMTVRKYSAMWLPLSRPNVAIKTYNAYCRLLDVMNRYVGDKQLRDVKPTDIKKVYVEYFTGKATDYTAKARALYTSMFNTALQEGYIVKNPCLADIAKPPKGTRGTHRNITQEERNIIMNTPHELRDSAVIMLYSGLRMGELLGLKYQDIYDGYIHVRRELSPLKDTYLPGKTQNAQRNVPLIPPLTEMLSKGQGYVVKDANGVHIQYQNYVKKWRFYMAYLSEIAGYQFKVRCHDLRHSYVVYCINAGVDVKTLSNWVGHADTTMIMRIYDHINDQRTNDCISRLIAYGGQNGGQQKQESSNIKA